MMRTRCARIIISFLLVFAVMINTAVPAMAVTEDLIVLTIGSDVNVRAGAGTSYSKLGTVQYAGTQFAYLGEAKDTKGALWYKIQYTSSKAGWISGAYSVKLSYTEEYIQSYVEAIAKRYGAVGVQVAVVENGEVTDTYNYGYATKTSAPMTDDTKIRIASVSKVVLAMEAMKLQENGAVSMTENIGQYWGATLPKAVTLHSLFTHTSTLKSLSYYSSKTDTLNQIKKSGNYSSGTVGQAKTWAYNNYAIGIAGSTLEVSQNKTVDSMVREHFFTPLGIDASYFAGDVSDTSKLATLYSSNDSVSRSVATQLKIKAGEPGANTAYFAGGLTISAKDMAKLTAVLANDGTYYGVKYLEKSSVESIEAKQFTATADGGSFFQCVPLRCKPGLYGQSELYYHTGNAYGTLALMSYNPVTRNGVVVITTGASETRDSQGIYDICGKITSFIYTVCDKKSDGGTTASTVPSSASSASSTSTASSASSSTSASSASSSSSVVSQTSATSSVTATTVSATDTTSTSTETTSTSTSTSTSATVSSSTTKITTTTSDTETILTVTGSVVNVRSGPGMEYPKVDTVISGEKYKVVGRQVDSEGGVWYAILKGDDIVFIDSKYGRISTVTTSSQTAVSSTESKTQTSISSSSTATSTSSTTTTTTTTTTQPLSDKAVRLGGLSRIDTANIVCREGWTTADNVILANGYSFADSLAGVPLAKALDAPILLTAGKTLEEGLSSELTRLSAKKVYILGGEIAVSAEVYSAIEAMDIDVERVAGASRYGTAVEIAKRLAQITGSQPSALYFASAVNYPDALAISAVAAIQGNPILYIPAVGELESGTAEFVSQSACDEAVILGGELAVSAQGESSVKSYIPDTERISGQSRYDTALRICRTYGSLFTSDYAAVATGVNFPDALAGGALAAKYAMPIVLVGASADSNTLAYMRELAPEKVFVFGGTGAVSNEVVNELLK